MTGAQRVARRRAALRAQGLRPKQFWVPDVHSSAFRQQATREVAALNAGAGAADDQAFIDSVSDVDNWPPYDGAVES